mmetsp:Transcript_73599/g.215930  ORF Transcript_73599/g.215930 Transcript_73599/m.215930 type:complete len:266 (+) Transcript_73599:155-952(+)
MRPSPRATRSRLPPTAAKICARCCGGMATCNIPRVFSKGPSDISTKLVSMPQMMSSELSDPNALVKSTTETLPSWDILKSEIQVASNITSKDRSNKCLRSPLFMPMDARPSMFFMLTTRTLPWPQGARSSGGSARREARRSRDQGSRFLSSHVPAPFHWLKGALHGTASTPGAPSSRTGSLGGALAGCPVASSSGFKPCPAAWRRRASAARPRSSSASSSESSQPSPSSPQPAPASSWALSGGAPPSGGGAALVQSRLWNLQSAR